MKNLSYSPDVKEIVMPQTHSIAEWTAHFNKLMEVDHFAPAHAVMGYFSFLSDNKYGMISSPYGELYRDEGLEMACDDRYPALVSALNSGFYQAGIRTIVGAAVADDGRDRALLEAARDIAESEDLTEFVPEALAVMLTELLGRDPESDSPHPDEKAEYEIGKRWWVQDMESEMKEDPNAAASVLGYYLEAVLGKPCTIFCPLGYEPYIKLGKAMASSVLILDAAREAGLLAAGIEQYVSAALSNDECWNVMGDGVAYLLREPSLSCFIPYRERFLAKALLGQETDTEKGKRSWNERFVHLRDELGDEWRGY